MYTEVGLCAVFEFTKLMHFLLVHYSAVSDSDLQMVNNESAGSVLTRDSAWGKKLKHAHPESIEIVHIVLCAGL